jgi:hypothetical protein
VQARGRDGPEVHSRRCCTEGFCAASVLLAFPFAFAWSARAGGGRTSSWRERRVARSSPVPRGPGEGIIYSRELSELIMTEVKLPMTCGDVTLHALGKVCPVLACALILGVHA